MYTSILKSSDRVESQGGSALVIAIIVLAILGALGYAALDVADLNIFMSANDRDSKGAFFHADSGVNVGHELLEEALFDINSTFYGNDATTWANDNVFNASQYTVSIYTSIDTGTFIRAGQLDTEILEGSAMQIGAGYEGVGKSAAHGGIAAIFLIQSHREGERNSRSQVDLGWRHIAN